LRRRVRDLEVANHAIEDFLSTLSHELRTPLNAMLGWTRLLRTGQLDPAACDRALETIERNARAQEQLIADILDASRIVTGHLRLDVRPVRLPALLASALESVRSAAEAKGITVETSIDFRGSVRGDPGRLQQVVRNLLENAIKFTPASGHVRVSLQKNGDDVALTVSDTGQGISPEFLPYIFDRFRQADTSVTRSHGGLGLGLAIVRHVVELHGGRVQVASEGPGRGASFSVCLPLGRGSESV
jgi:signal transduction histidine kinase